MRKLKTRALSILLAAVMVVTMLPAVSLTAFAAGLPISEENFPDANFRSYVSSKFDSDKDGSLSDEEISAVTDISLYDEEIKSLAGIEYFKDLTYLSCDHNQLTSLDVSNNPKLTSLSCGYNKLTTLDVSNNPELTSLSCVLNNLTTLDVSNNPELTELYCTSNELTTLDVSKNPKLQRLSCSDNRLTMLDVSNNPELTSLNCGSNVLTTLDVSNSPKLTTLYCEYNNLATLDVSNNPELTNLECNDNHLATLDVSNNLKLTTLYCDYNNLTTLDVSNNPELSYLKCEYNNLTMLDLSKKIGQLSCYYQASDAELIKGDDGYSVDIAKLVGDENKEKVSVSDNAWSYDSAKGIATCLGSGSPESLTYVYYGENIVSYGMDVTLYFDTTKIPIDEENFPDVNFRTFVLNEFDADKDCALSTGEISAVTKIYLYENEEEQIESLTGIENFVKLNELYCANNKLTTLDISQNPNIFILDCSRNQLSTLIIGKKWHMAYFNCSDNLLTTLDLSECSGGIDELYCSDNLLTSIYLYGDAKPSAASENINRPIPRDLEDPSIFNCENNRFTALDLSKRFDKKYCSGQTSEAEMVKTSDGYAVDLSKLVGVENKAKVTVPENWSYDSETGIAACAGAVAPETLKYNYFGLNLPTSGMDVTLTLTVKGGGEIEPDKDKILVMKKEQIKAYVDGQILPMTDYGNGNFAMAKSMNGTYALPLRCIGEAFDMRVDYLGSGKTKITNAAGEYVVVTRDSNILEKYDADNNLINSFTADFATFTDEAGITYAPMRAVSEALGLGVSYVGSGTTGHGSYVAVSTDLFLNLKPDYVLAEIEKAYALGL